MPKKDYQYYFSQLRRIEDHREEQAVKEIRKIYRDILKETRHFIADEYAALAEDGVLTYDILRAKSQDARFLQEVEQRLGDLSIDVSRQIKKSTEEMYQLAFDGIREAAVKSKDLEEFRETLGGMDMTKAQQMWHTVDNTIMDIALEKNHKNIIWDIKREIATALTVGDRFDTMADRLAKSLDGNYKKATLIARTEVHRVREAAHSASAKDLNETLKKGNSGLRYVKKWKTMKDGAVRPQSRYKTKKGWKTGKRRPGAPDHMKMHNVVVLEEEQFDLGGGVMTDAPGQSGVAGHDCNCRCQCLHLLMDDQEFFETTGRHFPGAEKELTETGEGKEETKTFDITEDGKYTHLEIQDKDEYARYIEHDFTTQRLTVRELHQMWDKNLGYIQNSKGYQDINGFLRGLKPNLDNPQRRFTINIMKRVTSNNSLKRDFIGMRKVDASYVANVLGLDVGSHLKSALQRNAFGRMMPVQIPKDKMAAQSIADAINGLVGTEKGTITDSAFTSVSLSEGLNYFTHFPFKFEIQMPSGTKGLITNNLPESEFITKCGSAIEIMGAEVYNDGNKDCVKIFARLRQ